MSGTGTIVEPHDKMRSRDVGKVARGEQAPRPPQQTPNVSTPPPPSSTSSTPSSHPPPPPPPQVERSKNIDDQDEEEDEYYWLNEANASSAAAGDHSRLPLVDKPHYCYTRYLEYYICTRDKGKGHKGKDAQQCEKFAEYYTSICPIDWIEKWNEQRDHGTFPSPPV